MNKAFANFMSLTCISLGPDNHLFETYTPRKIVPYLPVSVGRLKPGSCLILIPGVFVGLVYLFCAILLVMADFLMYFVIWGCWLILVKISLPDSFQA